MDPTLLAHLTSKLEEVQHNHNFFDSVSDNICASTRRNEALRLQGRATAKASLYRFAQTAHPKSGNIHLNACVMC